MNPQCLVPVAVALCFPASPADLPGSIAEAVSAKLASRLGEPVKGHDNMVVDVELSPDGSLALSAGWDGVVKVWNAKNGKELRALTGHDELLYWAHFTGGRKRVVSGAMDKTIRVWDATSGEELARLETEQTLQVSAITPDGRWLAASSPEEKMVRLYDLEKSCEPAGELPHEAKGILLNLAFSPDGVQLASAGMFDDFVQVHDVAKREVLFSGPAPFGVSALAWAPDGESLYLGGSDDVVQWGVAKPGLDLTPIRRCTQGPSPAQEIVLLASPRGCEMGSAPVVFRGRVLVRSARRIPSVAPRLALVQNR